MIKTIFLDRRCSLERAWRAADGSDDHEPAVALWDAGPLGVESVCKPCLDASLDWADANGTGEPTALTWLLSPNDYRLCWVHGWPELLCRDWSHGLFSDKFGQFVKPPSIARHITIERWQVGEA